MELRKQTLVDAFKLDPQRNAHIVNSTSPAVLVIDSFYSFPEQVVEIASVLDYNIGLGATEYRLYPGERASLSLGIPDVEEEILQQYGEVSKKFAYLKSINTIKPVTFTRMNDSTIKFAHARQRVPHIDSDCELIAVIYLGESSEAQESKTIFYRHLETGLSYLPTHPDAELVRKALSMGFNILNIQGYQDFVRKLMFSGDAGRNIEHNKTGLDAKSEEWEIILEIEARYNRCAIFPARLFHSPVYKACADSNRLISSRLTQNLFFCIS